MLVRISNVLLYVAWYGISSWMHDSCTAFGLQVVLGVPDRTADQTSLMAGQFNQPADLINRPIDRMAQNLLSLQKMIQNDGPKNRPDNLKKSY